MSGPRIDLVYFDGCPNAAEARDNLRAALTASGGRLDWAEWDLTDVSTPERFRRYGSPTVLVDGRDVRENRAGAVAMACRRDGAPSVAAIREGIARRGAPG